MKLALVALNAKGGMGLLLEAYVPTLGKYFDVVLLSGSEHQSKSKCDQVSIGQSKSHFHMFICLINPVTWVKAIGFFIRHNPDVCLFISAHPMHPALAGLLKMGNFFSGRRAIIISHIHDIFPHSNTQGYWIIDAVQKVQAILSDYISVYGSYLRQAAEERYPFSSKKILSLALGALRHPDEMGGPEKAEVKPIYVSLLGRIDHYKGVQDFIDLAKLFPGDGPIFLIAGSGDLSPYSIPSPLPKNLKIENRFLSNREMDNYIRQSYVQVLPYRDASQSGAIPLAYAYGCPVVVTNSGGLPECVVEGKTGFVCETGNIGGMAEKIKRIISSSGLRKQLAGNCVDYYHERFKWENSLKEFSAEIKNL